MKTAKHSGKQLNWLNDDQSAMQWLKLPLETRQNTKKLIGQLLLSIISEPLERRESPYADENKA